MARIECDVCVIGAGSAGLSVAAGTSQLGLRTVLVERGEMGGECLNVGCVPSKALLAAADRAHAPTGREMPGIGATSPAVDFGRVKDHVAATIAAIAPHDSVERFEGLGVTVLRDSARFRDPRALEVGRDLVVARRYVIATGSSPAIPDIPGLDPSRSLTNETVFALRERPDHLVILGGGPIGVEMAQAHRRLGSAVTVIQRSRILSRDEPELVDILRDRLVAEGVQFRENATVRSVRHGDGAVTLTIERGGRTEDMAGSHLLVAVGRRASTGDLDLAAAGVEHGPNGIKTDRRLRTSQRHIYALGDVIDGPRFTHAASYQAGIVVRNLAFRLPAKVDYRALPWATFSDPELAHVGMTEAEARDAHGSAVTAVTASMARNDRAIAERRTEGLVKIVAGRRGRILGASILAPHAGDIIGLWCLAISRGLTLRAVTDTILPYPTLGEAGKATASSYYTPSLFSERTRRAVRFLQRLPG
jgi:pyruvate/2-oxoglutarate dehydrogenase complex dihydrolipoamide dehydrogenase (E3) component